MSKRLKYRIIIRETTIVDRLLEVHARDDREAQSIALSTIANGNYRELEAAGHKHDVAPTTITRDL